MRILFVQYANPAAYPPVVRAATLLARQGFEILILDPGSSDTSEIHFPETEGIRVISLRYVSPGWKQKLHYVRYALTALWLSATWRPRWVYGSDFLAAPILLCMRIIPGVRVIYHEHDTPYGTPGTLFEKLCLACRKTLGSSAEAVIAPNADRLADLTQQLRPRAALLVWNCPMRDEIPKKGRDSSSSLRLLYHGSINDSRIPESLVAALALLPENVTLTIAGYETVGSRGHAAQLARTAETLGVGHRFRILPPMDHRNLEKLRHEHDVGIAVVSSRADDANLRKLAGASCKVFEYMASGVVPLVSASSDWQKDFIVPGYAIGCDADDPSSIARAIDAAFRDRALLERISTLGRARIESDWNYDTQFAPVMSLISAGGD